MKRNSITKSTLFIFSSLFFLFNSCISDVDLLHISNEIKIDQSLVLPIGEAKLTINDIFMRFGMPSGIDTLSNEIYYQNTSSTEYTFKPVNLTDSIKPFTKTLTPIAVPIIYPANFPITLPTVNDTLGLGINSNVAKQRIDILKLSSTTLDVSIDASPDIKTIPASDIKVEFVFNTTNLKIDNGINPSFTPVVYGQKGQITMGNYTINPNGSTKIPFSMNVTVKKQNIPINLGPTSKIYITLKFTDIVLSEAWGLFRFSINDSQTAQVNLASTFPNSFLRFESPTIDISATSNFGADLVFNLDYLRTYNSTNPAIFQAAWFNDHTSNSTKQYLNGPTMIGTTATSSLTQFNNTNGEIDKLFDTNPYPNTIDFKYTVADNPLPSRTTNFITADNKLKFDLKTRVKLSFKDGSNYSIKDTIRNVGQSLGTILDGVDSAVLVLNFANGLPVKAIYRMTFWKSSANNDTIESNVVNIKDESAIGTMFSRYQLNSPDINSDGTVKTGGIKTQTVQIGLSKNTIDELKKTKFIVYSVDLAGDHTLVNGVQTTNPIHFTTKNSFGVKLGVFVKANTTMTLKSNKKSK